MMRLFLLIILILSFSHCSFDNKTGIWTNNQETVKKKEDKFKNFEKLYIEKKLFNKIINPDDNLWISLDPIKKNIRWFE